MREVELLTDSATVHRWIEDGLSGRTRLRTKAANGMLIRLRVETVLSLVKEYNLKLAVTLVRSAMNKADALTRVPTKWLAAEPVHQLTCAAVDDPSNKRFITQVHHDAGHPGVRRTLYFVRRRGEGAPTEGYGGEEIHAVSVE
ncbi:hypothetical protein TTRE_0000905501 [Trichuris trichiura]|uniref:Uncharacterized protein n=1 Tax=Trichuris trichiura TaxID=36087 RepID=A0A077ZLV4_TRITR|nr:hypothetical protein TTRE_0000905501 [Trichuris trichiura]